MKVHVRGESHQCWPSQVDEVYYVDELKRVLTEKAPGRLVTLFGQNTDSGTHAKPGMVVSVKCACLCVLFVTSVCRCCLVWSATFAGISEYVLVNGHVVCLSGVVLSYAVRANMPEVTCLVADSMPRRTQRCFTP